MRSTSSPRVDGEPKPVFIGIAWLVSTLDSGRVRLEHDGDQTFFARQFMMCAVQGLPFVAVDLPMPHLITHRPRLMNLRSDDETDYSHKAWETFSALSYEIGGVMFVIGSVCFFPALSRYMGAGDWLFIVGSILYLSVTGHELLEVRKYWKLHGTDTFADRIEFIAAWSYVLGSVLFVIGSVFFLPGVDATAPGAWMFIIGSVLFLVGGLINILQVVEAPSLIYMQLFNFTIALFVIGSALFAEATIPYLWHLTEPVKTRISTFDAAQFVAGSVLFLVGGMAIYYRKLVRGRLEAFCRVRELGTMFISALQSEIHDKATLGIRRKHDDDATSD